MTKENIIAYNKKYVSAGHSAKGYGKTYFAKQDFIKGDVIVKGFGRIIDHQTKHISVQIGLNKHFLPQFWAGRLFNHSCNPNCHIESRRNGFPNWVASRRIRKGEELTYAYYMTELQWDSKAHENKITCGCGHSDCHQKIPTFSHLSPKHKKKIVKKRLISDYLSKLHLKAKTHDIA